MADLFAFAAANEAGLEKRFTSLKASLTSTVATVIDSFTRLVSESGHISINLRQSAILKFLTSGKHQTVYEAAEGESTATRRTVEQILRDRLGAYYERRMCFDAHFGGREFRYGALNIGGAGASRYGDFCTVLRAAFAQGLERLVYLKLDSLRGYIVSGPTVDESTLKQDLARHVQRQMLASIKHSAQVATTPESDWPTLLCNDSDYIEAIFVCDLTSSLLESVRMTSSDYQRYVDLVVEATRGNISDGEVALVAEFQQIMSQLLAQGIQWEVIDG